MTSGQAIDSPFESTLSRRQRPSAKTLYAVPAAFVLLAVSGMALSGDAASLYYRSVVVSAALITAASALWTTSRFSFGDRLYLSWAALGVGYLLSGIRHGLRLWAQLTGASLPPPSLMDLMMIVQNVAVAFALLWFVLAWRSTGLTGPLERAAEIRWMVIGLVVALLAGGYPLMRGLSSAAESPAILISTVGDIIGLALIVPLMIPALAMRGGMLMHIWLALALSEVAWLGYDVWSALRPDLALPANAELAVLEIFRLLAVSMAFVATAAQRRAMR